MCKIQQVIGPIILFFGGQQLYEFRSILVFSDATIFVLYVFSNVIICLLLWEL